MLNWCVNRVSKTDTVHAPVCIDFFGSLKIKQANTKTSSIIPTCK